MKIINSLMVVTLILSIFSCEETNQEGKDTENRPIVFPKVSPPIQITDNKMEHLFASYYGINSFDYSERYVMMN